MARRCLRETWLRCLYEFASPTMQRWWLGDAPHGIDVSFVELMCGYFDDLDLDSGLDAAVHAGWISAAEARVTAELHRRADAYQPRSEAHDAILADPAWADVVVAARRAWYAVRAIHEDAETLAVMNALEAKWGRIAPVDEARTIQDPGQAEVVRRGVWRYDGVLRLEIRIVRRFLFPGSGDHEDPPEIAEDREIECFEVLAETVTRERPRFAGLGFFETLAAAVRSAERVIAGGVEWDDGSLE